MWASRDGSQRPAEHPRSPVLIQEAEDGRLALRERQTQRCSSVFLLHSHPWKMLNKTLNDHFSSRRDLLRKLWPKCARGHLLPLRSCNTPEATLDKDRVESQTSRNSPRHDLLNFPKILNSHALCPHTTLDHHECQGQPSLQGLCLIFKMVTKRLGPEAPKETEESMVAALNNPTLLLINCNHLKFSTPQPAFSKTVSNKCHSGFKN